MSENTHDQAAQQIDQVISDVTFGRYKKARMACSRLIRELGGNPKAWVKVVIESVRILIITGNYKAALRTIDDIERLILKKDPDAEETQTEAPVPNEGKAGDLDAQEAPPTPVATASNSDETETDDIEMRELDLVFDLQTAFCKAMRDGKLKNLEPPFEKGFKWLCSGGIEDDLEITRYRVLALSYLNKLSIIAKTFKYPSEILTGDTVKQSLMDTLSVYIHKLRQSDRISDAYILTQSLNTLTPKSTNSDNLLKLLGDCKVETSHAATVADIYFDLAQAALSVQRIKLAKSYAVLALTVYNSIDHLLGIKRVLFLQIKLTDDYDHGTIVGANRCNQRAIISLCNFHGSIEDNSGFQSLHTNWMLMASAVGNIGAFLALSDELCQMMKQLDAIVPCVQARVIQIRYFFARTGNNAKTLECVDAFLQDIEGLEIPYFYGTVASLASETYGAMKRNHTALKFAEIALEKLLLCGPEAESYARFELLKCQKHIIGEKLGLFERSSALAPIIKTANDLIAIDLDRELYSEAVEKLLFLAEVHFEELGKSAFDRFSSMNAAFGLAIKYSSKLNRRESQRVLASALESRGRWVLLIPGIPTPAQREASLRDLQKSLDHYQRLKMRYKAAGVMQTMGLAWFNRDANRSISYFESAYDTYEIMGQTTECIAASSLTLRTCYNIWKRSGRLGEISKNFEAALERTSKWLDYRRIELSALGGLQAIIEKQSLARDAQVRIVSETAVNYCVESWSAEQAWYWVQKQKARSVSDMMGLGYSSSEYSAAHKAESGEAAILLEEHTRLLSQIRDASPVDRLTLRVAHARLLDRMSNHVELKGFLNLQMGQSIDFTDLEDMFPQDTGFDPEKIVLIDWFSTEKDIYIISARYKELPKISKLDKPVKYVTKWIADNYTTPDDRENTLDCDPDDSDAPFRELDFLISPLAEFTEPGDLLVLTPARPIHSIPLHALVLASSDGYEEEEDILIRRNPVLYTPSLTILKHCIARAGKPRTFDPRGIRCAAIYEYPPTQPFRAAEQAMIKDNIEDLAELLHTTPLWGASCTKESLQKHLNGGSLLHFHGHCHYDNTNILNHALVTSGVYNKLSQKDQKSATLKVVQEYNEKLSSRILFLSQRPEDLADVEVDSPIRSQDTGLSISEIFEIDLADPVVTIIACESASQQVGPGDEPLGLATAFLCAGASSYVGTIWEMPCKEARVFSTAFYQNILDQRDGGGKIVNLALALQAAVIRVMGIPMSRNYMYWAPLVLHGSWFCQSDVFWADE